MAELELREEALFQDMSEEEIQQAIRFMQRLDDVRASLEDAVSKESEEAKHIYIEFGLPEKKAPAKEKDSKKEDTNA
jgi:zinc transporter 9